MFVYKVQRNEKYKGWKVNLCVYVQWPRLNLGLDVLRKREDGYHEVRMIMQTIQMYDVLDMKKVKKPGISLSANLPYIPSMKEIWYIKQQNFLWMNLRSKKAFPSADEIYSGGSRYGRRKLGCSSCICRSEPDVSSGTE